MTALTLGDQPRLCAGPSYLERLGIVYMEQIRLTIVTELYMREMGVREFYETVGGSSYSAVRRHFLKLVEHGWLRRVRTAAVRRGRPEVLYRATELAVINTETWRTIPFSIRDAFSVQLLEEQGGRLGEALERGIADGRPDRVAAFKIIEVDELGWCEAYGAVEQCFETLLQEQIDAKIRIENSGDDPLLMIVNLAAFEAPRSAPDGVIPLPKAGDTAPSASWPQRIGKLFADHLDLEIVDELNQTTMTPAELEATLGGGGIDSLEYHRRCRRLKDLGWVVSIDSETGGALHGAIVHRFRAAAPNVSESDIYERVPAAARNGRSWDVFEAFIANSIGAIEAGRFNNRLDRHLTMSPLLVDEIGWRQVTKALRTFEATLLRLERLPIRHHVKAGDRFPAAFLLASFQGHQRDVRQ